jgi:hypothetical protein
MSLELIPGDGVDVCMGVAVCLPLVGCCPIELVCSKKGLLAICALGNNEFLLNPLEPIFCVHGVFGLREGGGASVTPRSEKEGTKPPYVCPGCSNHTYGQQYGEQIQYLVKLQTRIFTK